MELRTHVAGLVRFAIANRGDDWSGKAIEAADAILAIPEIARGIELLKQSGLKLGENLDQPLG